jgi:hypothetical protein
MDEMETAWADGEEKGRKECCGGLRTSRADTW